MERHTLLRLFVDFSLLDGHVCVRMHHEWKSPRVCIHSLKLTSTAYANWCKRPRLYPSTGRVTSFCQKRRLESPNLGLERMRMASDRNVEGGKRFVDASTDEIEAVVRCSSRADVSTACVRTSKAIEMSEIDFRVRRMFSQLFGISEDFLLSLNDYAFIRLLKFPVQWTPISEVGIFHSSFVKVVQHIKNKSRAVAEISSFPPLLWVLMQIRTFDILWDSRKLLLWDYTWVHFDNSQEGGNDEDSGIESSTERWLNSTVFKAPPAILDLSRDQN